ncbi:MAG: hypothetical protein J6Y77_05045 [Paludibacteraceae bacterium]|nr:hypothetical protein [Paludibacteraceae bacterium]
MKNGKNINLAIERQLQEEIRRKLLDEAKRQNYTRYRFIQESGMTQGTVISLFSDEGPKFPSYLMLQMLALALGYTVTTVENFQKESPMKCESPDEETLSYARKWFDENMPMAAEDSECAYGMFVAGIAFEHARQAQKSIQEMAMQSLADIIAQLHRTVKPHHIPDMTVRTGMTETAVKKFVTETPKNPSFVYLQKILGNANMGLGLFKLKNPGR